MSSLRLMPILLMIAHIVLLRVKDPHVRYLIAQCVDVVQRDRCDG